MKLRLLLHIGLFLLFAAIGISNRNAVFAAEKMLFMREYSAWSCDPSAGFRTFKVDGECRLFFSHRMKARINEEFSAIEVVERTRCPVSDIHCNSTSCAKDSFTVGVCSSRIEFLHQVPRSSYVEEVFHEQECTEATRETSIVHEGICQRTSTQNEFFRYRCTQGGTKVEYSGRCNAGCTDCINTKVIDNETCEPPPYWTTATDRRFYRCLNTGGGGGGGTGGGTGGDGDGGDDVGDTTSTASNKPLSMTLHLLALLSFALIFLLH